MGYPTRRATRVLQSSGTAGSPAWGDRLWQHEGEVRLHDAPQSDRELCVWLRPQHLEAARHHHHLHAQRRGGRLDVALRAHLRQERLHQSLRARRDSARERGLGGDVPPTTFTWNGFARPAAQSNFGATEDYRITTYELGGTCATSPSTCLAPQLDARPPGRPQRRRPRRRPSARSTIRRWRRGRGSRSGSPPATAPGPRESTAPPSPARDPYLFLDTAVTAASTATRRADLRLPGRRRRQREARRGLLDGLSFQGLPASGLRGLLLGTPVSWNDNQLRDPMPIHVADLNGDGFLDVLAGDR